MRSEIYLTAIAEAIQSLSTIARRLEPDERRKLVEDLLIQIGEERDREVPFSEGEK